MTKYIFSILKEPKDVDEFVLLMLSPDNQIVAWPGKFIYTFFNTRSNPKLWRYILCFVYPLYPEGHNDTSRLFSAYLIIDRISKHDGKLRQYTPEVWHDDCGGAVCAIAGHTD